MIVVFLSIISTPWLLSNKTLEKGKERNFWGLRYSKKCWEVPISRLLGFWGVFPNTWSYAAYLDSSCFSQTYSKWTSSRIQASWSGRGEHWIVVEGLSPIGLYLAKTMLIRVAQEIWNVLNSYKELFAFTGFVYVMKKAASGLSWCKIFLRWSAYHRKLFYTHACPQWGTNPFFDSDNFCMTMDVPR